MVAARSIRDRMVHIGVARLGYTAPRPSGDPAITGASSPYKERRMHRPLAAILALALVLGVGRVALAAEGPDAGPAGQPPDIRPFTSAHFGLAGTAKVDGVTVDVLGEGDLAPPDRQRSSFKFGPFTAEIVMVGGTVFTRTRFEPRWSREVVPEPIDIGPLSGSELTQVGRDARLVGTETVDGVATRHYTSTLDLSPLLGPLVPAVPDRDVQAALRSLNGTIDVWVGGQDQMLRQERMILSMNLPSIEPNGDPMTGTIDLTIAYSKLNEPVDIREPSRSDTSPLLSPRPDFAPVIGPPGAPSSSRAPGGQAGAGAPGTPGRAPAQAPAQIPRR
jgi:hypothetical protein